MDIFRHDLGLSNISDQGTVIKSVPMAHNEYSWYINTIL